MSTFLEKRICPNHFTFENERVAAENVDGEIWLLELPYPRLAKTAYSG